MTEFNLDSFLTQQEEEGLVDSSGDFSIDASAAARKLARFALPESNSWVLKLLQAAVGWEAISVLVRQSRRYTSFILVLPEDGDFPSRERLLATLLSSEIGGPRAIQRLAMALRSLVEQSGLSFVLGVQPPTEEHYSIYAGDYAGRLSQKDRESWAKVPGVGMRLVVGHEKSGEHILGRLAPRFMLNRVDAWLA